VSARPYRFRVRIPPMQYGAFVLSRPSPHCRTAILPACYDDARPAAAQVADALARVHGRQRVPAARTSTVQVPARGIGGGAGVAVRARELAARVAHLFYTSKRSGKKRDCDSLFGDAQGLARPPPLASSSSSSEAWYVCSAPTRAERVRRAFSLGVQFDSSDE